MRMLVRKIQWMISLILCKISDRFEECTDLKVVIETKLRILKQTTHEEKDNTYITIYIKSKITKKQ